MAPVALSKAVLPVHITGVLVVGTGGTLVSITGVVIMLILFELSISAA